VSGNWKKDRIRSLCRCKERNAEYRRFLRSRLFLIGCFPSWLFLISFHTCSSGFNSGERLGKKKILSPRLLRLTEPRLPSCPYHSQGVLLGAQTLRPAKSGQPVPL
jgi:hypothetical protein